MARHIISTDIRTKKTLLARLLARELDPIQTTDNIAATILFPKQE